MRLGNITLSPGTTLKSPVIPVYAVVEHSARTGKLVS
jgi:hypothetical protein